MTTMSTKPSTDPMTAPLRLEQFVRHLPKQQSSPPKQSPLQSQGWSTQLAVPETQTSLQHVSREMTQFDWIAHVRPWQPVPATQMKLQQCHSPAKLQSLASAQTWQCTSCATAARKRNATEKAFGNPAMADKEDLAMDQRQALLFRSEFHGVTQNCHPILLWYSKHDCPHFWMTKHSIFG